MKTKHLIVLAIITTLMTGCFAGPETQEAAGFMLGLWHGMILPIAFFISIFDPNVFIYALNNTGTAYDFGFLLGAWAIWAGSSSATSACQTSS